MAKPRGRERSHERRRSRDRSRDRRGREHNSPERQEMAVRQYQPPLAHGYYPPPPMHYGYGYLPPPQRSSYSRTISRSHSWSRKRGSKPSPPPRKKPAVAPAAAPLAQRTNKQAAAEQPNLSSEEKRAPTAAQENTPPLNGAKKLSASQRCRLRVQSCRRGRLRSYWQFGTYN